MRLATFAAAALLSLRVLAAEPAPPLEQLKALAGSWVGEGSGKPGEATGAFELRFDLQEKVMVRKSFADYPQQNGRPAFRHEDLMVIWAEASGALVAKYWDNEGHVVDYRIKVEEGGKKLVFTSRHAPLYRLTYHFEKPDLVVIEFAVAMSGKRADLKQYLSAKARRKP